MTILGATSFRGGLLPSVTRTLDEKIRVRVHASEFIIQDPTAQHLKRSVQVAVAPAQGGHWIAQHPVIGAHGYGRTEREAVADFHDMMIGLFLELTESESELAPHLRLELDYLRQIIVEDSVR
jgi:hypothetical protein